ncbi:MORC family CW-type zinc finger protein 3a isoform X1 [Hippoglossus hippoglossus]|uniref:MORC family CW-type zinc finger protein 3a isoform X1 n=1 Tax=Hippoglossus hippoglossus TaxID=8267 RepID=UPI00148D3D4C|nr:MORC family CW-type zinc finger protein 3a isoform X1 [Hippoglossus hippoglossus]
MAAQTDLGVPLSTLCPKFLHTNSTSHTWPFSAIAELIDNAFDTDVNAKQFWIDKIVVDGQECLSFMDNGEGLDHETMHKMLSFGYSDKTVVNGVAPIGIYGNGFKSGSMRLGKDAIVFSKSKNTSCVGMLSQTYLEEIKAKQIIVPIISFANTKKNKFSVREQDNASLQHILCHSIFKKQEKLLTELQAISPPWSTGKTGTRIIIWNLRRTSVGDLEFDFQKDRYDIQIPSDIYESRSDTSQHQLSSYIPESVYSLRAYCSVLYLKPRMQIVIRGQKVKSQLIAKSLAYIRKDHYKPTFLTKRVPITFGYNTKSKEQYGMMMYHKNRLIKAYERVGCQMRANRQGVGVIGVIECNFLNPTHNKQSFDETDKYRKTMNSMATKLEEYWKEIHYSKNKDNPNSTTPVEDTMKRPDQNWAQCDACGRWRKLPDGIDCDKLPKKWFCHLNPDPQFRSCLVEEEPEDSDDEQPSYYKTYKQQEKKDKKQQEMHKQKEEENRRRQEVQRVTNLARQNQALKQQHEDLKRQLCQTTVDSPSTPITPKRRSNADSTPVRPSILQADCSPSRDDLPVISNVVSLSKSRLKRKRKQSVSPQTKAKRSLAKGFQRSISDTPTTEDVSATCSPSVPVGGEWDEDTDDDIFLLENASTPKPKSPCFALTKVKIEPEPTYLHGVGVLECSDDVAVESEPNTAGASSTGCAAVGADPSPAPPPQLTSTNTQTEAPKVKEEEEDPNQTEGNGVTGQGTSNVNGVEHISRACCTEERVVKQESEVNTQNEHQRNLQNGVTHPLEGDEIAGPSRAPFCPLNNPSVTDIQEQQDQLLELMQETAQERDSLKDEVNRLTCQLQEMQSRLLEPSEINDKRRCSHQASQTLKTEETVEGIDYKSMFEKAKEKVDELIKAKEVLLAATESEPSRDQGEEKDSDEIALQVDSLMRELDQKHRENDQLHSQMDIVQGERTTLAVQCEELRLMLQQQRGNAEEGSTTPPQKNTDSSAQTDTEEAAGATVTGGDSSSDTFRSLIELRQNVGRLLITSIPALSLDQVNFECNVIDEILEQFLSERDSVKEEEQGN